MKILVACMACQAEQMSQGLEQIQVVISYTDLRDEGYYESECPQGHKSVTVLQQPKYHVLFDCGIKAMIDGYPRESISSIAASVERFYEFSIRVFLAAKGAPLEEVDKTWKLVKKQSERQLGAYCLLYLQHYSQSPDLMSNKLTEFRNDVIHGGYIPTYSEALKYGEAAFQHILSLQQRLQGSAPQAFGETYSAHNLSMATKFAGSGMTLANLCKPSVIEVASAETQQSLSDIISQNDHNPSWPFLAR